jgi:hypothetical protein
MNDLNNNKPTFNLPAYIQIPFFLYQDDRLEKSAMLIAAFFYSLYTSGLKITASKNYLCAIAGIGKTQYFSTLNQLESLGYIQRSGFTNRKKIQWIYSAKSEIFVDETSSSPAPRTNVKSLNTSPANRTKLVRPTEPILSGSPDTDIKEDTKDNKKTSTSENPSISFFFSSSIDKKLISFKLPEDRRSDEEFLIECKLHVDTKSDKSHKYLKRANSLGKLLEKLKEEGKIFFVSGTKSQDDIKVEEQSRDPGRDPTIEEWENWKSGIKGFEWVNAWRLKQQG